MAHQTGGGRVGSSHDSNKTTSEAGMVARLVQMQAAGADTAQLSVMAHSRADLLARLAATA